MQRRHDLVPPLRPHRVGQRQSPARDADQVEAQLARFIDARLELKAGDRAQLAQPPRQDQATVAQDHLGVIEVVGVLVAPAVQHRPLVEQRVELLLGELDDVRLRRPTGGFRG